MLRRTTAALAALLLLSLAACEDDPVPQELNPTGLAIVAGDNQVAPVEEGTSALRATVGAVDGVLPDTLIVQILGDTQTVGSSPLPTGPYTVAADPDVPVVEGTAIHYLVTEDGCGAPYITPVIPDSLAQGRTLWEMPGARANLTAKLPGSLGWHTVDGEEVYAARCEMDTRLQIGNSIVTDTTFVAYFEPGSAAALYLKHPADSRRVFLGDTLRLNTIIDYAEDAAGNRLPDEWVSWDRDPVFAPEGAESVDTAVATIHGVTREFELIALQEIGAGWTYERRCVDGIPDDYWSGDVHMDSLVITFVADSTRYLGLPSRYDENWLAGVRMWGTTTTRKYWPASADTTATDDWYWHLAQLAGEAIIVSPYFGDPDSPMAGNGPVPTEYAEDSSLECGTATGSQVFRAPAS